MSPLFTINADLKYVGQQLRRIADALEQLSPPPQESIDLKPDDAVTYVDEDAQAADELKSEVERAMDELRRREAEEAELPEGYGEGDVR